MRNPQTPLQELKARLDCCAYQSFTVWAQRKIQIARVDTLQNQQHWYIWKVRWHPRTEWGFLPFTKCRTTLILSEKCCTFFPDTQLKHHWYDLQIPTSKQTKPCSNKALGGRWGSLFLFFWYTFRPLLQGLRKITVGKNATWRTLKWTDYQNRKLRVNSWDVDPYV